MKGTRETPNGRLSRSSKLKKTTRRMKAKAAATKAKMSRVREETAQMVAAMGEIKLELDLLKISVHQLSDDMLLVSEALDHLTQIILEL